MKKRNYKLLAWILIITLFYGNIPAIALNTDAEKTFNKNTNTAISELPLILQEKIDIREESIKYFENEDGTFTAEVYSNPVHYEKNGVLTEIDNTLQLTKTNEGETSTWQNKSNDFIVNLPTTFNADSKIGVIYQNYSLHFNLTKE